ncbi:MAG: sigma-70 family RNA polymerase sigma factor [Anaerolineales bacterium]
MNKKPDFESLVEFHSGELFGYLWRLLGDEADARDCLQDTFLRAYRAYARVQDFSHLRAWLYKIATNAARTQLSRNHRRESRNAPLLEPIPSGERAVDVQVAERTQLAQVRQAVMALPDRQRAALMMRKYQQLEYAEIAAALGGSEETARANVYQALKKLRDLFADEVNDE